MSDWKDSLNRALRPEVPQASAELLARQEQVTPAWIADRGVDFSGLPSSEVVNLKSRIGCLQVDLASVRADLARTQAELKALRDRPETLADAELAHRQEMALDVAFKRRQDRDEVCP